MEADNNKNALCSTYINSKDKKGSSLDCCKEILLTQDSLGGGGG